MILSVGYNFDLSLIEKLSSFSEVNEIYGKMTTDYIGGGRSNYTFKNTGYRALRRSVQNAHDNGLKFNYLLNAASLNGLEQTTSGQRKIRITLDRLSESGVDVITVASPYLLRVIKKRYAHLKVKAGAFAVIDSPLKARQWEEMGADSLCISAISCNRNFEQLKAIRSAVQCECVLIANACCIQACSHEIAHMNLLSNSSSRDDRLKGFCIDHCFLNCSQKRLRDPLNYLRSIWIRPEDICLYENIGYSSFKLVERSSPTDLIIKRVKAYISRSHNGNLLEIVGPVASIKKELGAPLLQRIKMAFTMFRIGDISLRELLLIKKYASKVLMHEYNKSNADVYIDNKKLDGFLEGLSQKACKSYHCSQCGYCESFARHSIRINHDYRHDVLQLADQINTALLASY